LVNIGKMEKKIEYHNLKKRNITPMDIAIAFGYSSPGAFRNSSAYKRIMKGIDEIVGEVVRRIREEI
jgi:AraC-like DNA-binding protein